MKPEHVLLDVACGCLRGGCYFIKYLDKENYLGIDKEEDLIVLGVKEELGLPMLKEKLPQFVISDAFEFKAFSRSPDYALAQSLFTHMTEDDISLCLRNLRQFVRQECSFYATFFKSETEIPNLPRSNSHRRFIYTVHQMAKFGSEAGWDPKYIGDWGHPRGQMMMEYKAKSR